MTRSAARDLAFHLIFERAFRDESMEEIIAEDPQFILVTVMGSSEQKGLD